MDVLRDLEQNFRVDCDDVIEELLVKASPRFTGGTADFVLVRADPLNRVNKSVLEFGGEREYAAQESLASISPLAGLLAIEYLLQSNHPIRRVVVCHDKVHVHRHAGAARARPHYLAYRSGDGHPRITVMTPFMFDHRCHFLHQR